MIKESKNRFMASFKVKRKDTPTQNMGVEMKNGLPGIWTGIKHYPVAGLMHAMFASKQVSDCHHMPNQTFMPRFNLIQ